MHKAQLTLTKGWFNGVTMTTAGHAPHQPIAALESGLFVRRLQLMSLVQANLSVIYDQNHFSSNVNLADALKRIRKPRKNEMISLEYEQMLI